MTAVKLSKSYQSVSRPQHIWLSVLNIHHMIDENPHFVLAVQCDMNGNRKHDWFLLRDQLVNLCFRLFYERFRCVILMLDKKYFLFSMPIDRFTTKISHSLSTPKVTGWRGLIFFFDLFSYRRWSLTFPGDKAKNFMNLQTTTV